MAKIPPEQEAAYALDYGVARAGLSKDAQAAYDRLVEARARAGIPGPISTVDAEDRPVALPRWVSAAGTVMFFPFIGFGIVLLPWLITHYQAGAPPWPVAVRIIGVILIVAGGIVVIAAFVRFVTEGIGVPVPTTVTSRRLMVGGAYRYVRNPIYLAAFVATIGEALLLSRLVLLIYAIALLAACMAWVRLLEEPLLAKRFGAEYEVYRKRVPGWWPRVSRRTP
jgi:protein-S-isoprenylcysteine O-methyltransferase Ste14